MKRICNSICLLDLVSSSFPSAIFQILSFCYKYEVMQHKYSVATALVSAWKGCLWFVGPASLSCVLCRRCKLEYLQHSHSCSPMSQRTWQMHQSQPHLVDWMLCSLSSGYMCYWSSHPATHTPRLGCLVMWGALKGLEDIIIFTLTGWERIITNHKMSEVQIAFVTLWPTDESLHDDLLKGAKTCGTVDDMFS